MIIKIDTENEVILLESTETEITKRTLEAIKGHEILEKELDKMCIDSVHYLIKKHKIGEKK